MIPSEDEDSDVAVGDNDHVGKVEEANHQSCKVLALLCITRLRLHFARWPRLRTQSIVKGICLFRI